MCFIQDKEQLVLDLQLLKVKYEKEQKVCLHKCPLVIAKCATYKFVPTLKKVASLESELTKLRGQSVSSTGSDPNSLIATRVVRVYILLNCTLIACLLF